jgi:hypothetical protein
MDHSFETDDFKTEKRVWDHKFRPNLPTTPWSYLKQHIVTLSLSELGTRGEGGFAFSFMKMTFFCVFVKYRSIEYRTPEFWKVSEYRYRILALKYRKIEYRIQKKYRVPSSVSYTWPEQLVQLVWLESTVGWPAPVLAGCSPVGDTWSRNTIQYFTAQLSAVQFRTVQGSAVRLKCNAVRCTAVQYSTVKVRWSVVKCGAVQCSTIYA